MRGEHRPNDFTGRKRIIEIRGADGVGKKRSNTIESFNLMVLVSFFSCLLFCHCSTNLSFRIHALSLHGIHTHTHTHTHRRMDGEDVHSVNGSSSSENDEKRKSLRKMERRGKIDEIKQMEMQSFTLSCSGKEDRLVAKYTRTQK